MTIEEEKKMYTVKEARETINWSQGRLQRQSGLAKTSVIKAEQGRPIQKSTARLILMTINKEREERKLQPLSEKQMRWNIRDYGRGDEPTKGDPSYIKLKGEEKIYRVLLVHHNGEFGETTYMIKGENEQVHQVNEILVEEKLYTE